MTQLKILTVSELAASGAGVAYEDTLRIFVPGALPGDTVEAEVTMPAKGARSATAVVTKLLESSPDREPAPCAALCTDPACGGCPLGRLTYAAQRKLKEKLLTDALTAAGLEITPEPLLTAATLAAFRNKAVLYPVKNDSGFAFGMFAAGTHTVVPAAAHCPQVNPVFHTITDKTAEMLTQAALLPYDETEGTGDIRALLLRDGTDRAGHDVRLACLTVREDTPAVTAFAQRWAQTLTQDGLAGAVYLCVHAEPGNAVLSRDIRLLAGTDGIECTVGDLAFTVRPETFLQVNREQTPVLYRLGLEWLAPRKEEAFLDLFCGVGTITLTAALQTASATGIDIVPASIECARRNAALNDQTNTVFHAGPVETVLPALLKKGAVTADCAVLDPAFRGIEPPVITALTAMPLKRFVYISCNPKSFARDAARFEAAGWALVRIRPVDLFPGALHVETVGLFTR